MDIRQRFSSLWSSILSVALVLACSGTDTGNPITGTDTGNPVIVLGTLHDPEGLPLKNASVTVRRISHSRMQALKKSSVVYDSSSQTANWTTDSSGEFRLSGVSTGSFVLTAIASEKQLGIQKRFSIDENDSLIGLDTLITGPLVTLAWNHPDSLSGLTIRVLELGLDAKLSAEPFTLSEIPNGSYTILAPDGSTLIVLSTQDTTATPAPSSSSSSGMAPSSSSAEPDLSSSSAEPDTTNLYRSPGDPWVDARDGSLYPLVMLNTVEWMAVNLHYNMDSSTVCNSAETETDCSAYGRFYSFQQAQEACPKGMRVPAQSEYEALIKLAGGSTLAGVMLKSQTGWKTENGINEMQMNIYPAGTAHDNTPGVQAAFWTSTPDGTEAFAVVFSDTSGVAIEPQPLSNGLSVRCVVE